MAVFNLKATLEAEVINKLLVVMKAKDESLRVALESKMAGMGTHVGASTTYADLPTVDRNGKATTDGDSATLTAADGNKPTGLYRLRDGVWELEINYDEIGISGMKADIMDGTLTINQATGAVSGSGDAVDATKLAEALNALNSFNAGKYHPKGGDTALKVVGKDADENTQEFVTANQLKTVFTQDEINAKYDAL